MADFAPYQNSPEVERALSPPPRRSTSRSPQGSRGGPQGGGHHRSNLSSSSAALPPPSQFTDDDYSNGVTGGGGGGYIRTGGYQGGYQDIAGGDDGGGVGGAGGDLDSSGGIGGTGGRLGVNLFETSLPMRMDYEAMLSYILLPPAGGVLLLIIEHKSDYVRFHAYQSSLLFTTLFLLHLILSFSSILSWLLFTADMFLILFLAWHAYKDADLLDRFEVPFFGRLASDFVDAE
ncbi:MAG: hypothetical protein MMC33_006843 [Icmadophila ericetorum]|nr:hypothetical protein [Icmadophila ericetorum]